jgi:hypothetical protein
VPLDCSDNSVLCNSRLADEGQNHTLSWVILGFLVAFIGLSLLGPALAAVYFRANNYPMMHRAAMAPMLIFALPALIGVVKQLATGDL